MTAINNVAAAAAPQAATDPNAADATNSTTDAQLQQLGTAVATDVFSILLTLVLNQVGGDQ